MILLHSTWLHSVGCIGTFKVNITTTNAIFMPCFAATRRQQYPSNTQIWFGKRKAWLSFVLKRRQALQSFWALRKCLAANTGLQIFLISQLQFLHCSTKQWNTWYAEANANTILLQSTPKKWQREVEGVCMCMCWLWWIFFSKTFPLPHPLFGWELRLCSVLYFLWNRNYWYK